MDNQVQQPVSPAAPTPAAATPVPQQPAASVTQPAAPAASGTPAAPAPKKSSKLMLLLVILTLIVLVVAGWFGYTYFMNKSSETMYQSAKKQQVAPTAAPTPTAGPVKSGDAQLDQQSSAIDESMQKVENDVKSVDAGLNDQSVNLN